MAIAAADDRPCTFCGRGQEPARMLVATSDELGGSRICEDCIRFSARLVAERYAEQTKAPHGTVCALHPLESAISVCARCGVFICAGCERRAKPGARPRCPACDERAVIAATP